MVELTNDAGGVRAAVKPLEWRDHSFKDDFLLIGYHSFGEFKINREPDLVDWPFVLRPFIAGQSNYPSLDAAQAAAQADYERRILSALEPAPSPFLSGQEAMRALGVFAKWAMDVASLAELAALEDELKAVGLSMQEVGELAAAAIRRLPLQETVDAS